MGLLRIAAEPDLPDQTKETKFTIGPNQIFKTVRPAIHDRFCLPAVEIDLLSHPVANLMVWIFVMKSRDT